MLVALDIAVACLWQLVEHSGRLPIAVPRDISAYPTHRISLRIACCCNTIPDRRSPILLSEV